MSEERGEPEKADEGAESTPEFEEELRKPPAEAEDDEPFELSPEDREKLGRMAANLQDALNPELHFKLADVVGNSVLSKINSRAAGLGRFTPPESTLKNLTGISQLAAQQS